MLDPRIKDYLVTKEKKAIRKKNRWLFIVLDLAVISAIAGIFIILRKFVRNQLYSIREPDYLFYGGSLAALIGLIAAIVIIRTILEKKMVAPVTVEEKKTDEKAAIIGNLLVLSNSEGQLSFDISRIYNLESEDGKTSFMYNDPAGGITQFSCLDYYSPQIARMLHDKGVR